MYNFKKITRLFCLLISLTLLTSAVPAGKKTTPVKSSIESTTPTIFDLSNMSYSEMVTFTVKLKGEKLTLKEKVGLKVFKKQIVKADKPMAFRGKSQLVAVLLCGFVGILGIHRFYMGYTAIGILQFVTLGGCGIWTIIDLIRILMGELEPANGPWDTTL